MTMPSKRPTRAKTVYILSVSAFLALPLLVMGVLVDLEKIELNNERFCMKKYAVNRAEKEYFVWSGEGWSHYGTVTYCPLEFTTNTSTGRVCLDMVGEYAKIIYNDPANLTIYDLANYNGDWQRNKVLKVTSSGQEPKRREVCSSKGQMISIIWERANIYVTPQAIFTKAKFNVVEIGSHNRELAMEEYFCDQTYDLDHSIVRVVNSLGYSSTGTGRQKCVMHFIPPSFDNRARVCGAFFSSKDLDDLHCKDHAQPPWELIATPDYRNQRNRENVLFRARCGDTKFNRLKVTTFCGPQKTPLSVVMTRSQQMKDPKNLFQLLIADWTSSERELETAAWHVVNEVRDMAARKAAAQPIWVRVHASTSGAVAISATFSFVLAETILLVFSPFV